MKEIEEAVAKGKDGTVIPDFPSASVSRYVVGELKKKRYRVERYDRRFPENYSEFGYRIEVHW